MPLVKKADLGRKAPGAKEPRSVSAPAAKPVKPVRRKRATTAGERLDQSTQELAGGLGEAAAAATELQRAVDQISSGAEEAAGAAQESLGLIGNLRTGFREANDRAAASLRQTELLQSAFSESASQVAASVSAITLNARRQSASVAIAQRLEEAANGIVGIGATVGDLSEQTSMLALNASIEAARAGEDGKGFSIIADEVRELAENAEANARDIQRLAEQVVSEIRDAAERIGGAAKLAETEAETGADIGEALIAAQSELVLLASGARDIASAAAEAELAATESEKGAEQIASAAEEQSAAAAEAQQAITQQAVSLDQSQQTAEALGMLTSQLGVGDSASAAEQIAAAAEQLSATVQELSGASGEILVAIEQISRGAQVQSAATLQSGAAMTQIEKSAQLTQSRARGASERLEALVAEIARSGGGISRLVEGVTQAVADTRVVLDRLTGVGQTVRSIEKISDGLAMMALQTNMLAVSGAVEATRAGDAGTGFATVTTDIRKLAREAAGNADFAKDAVRAIQDELAVIRRDLDQIVAAGEAEAGRNSAMVDRFAEMTRSLDETNSANLVILERADLALRSAQEVKLGCDQIAIAAELAAGAAREAGTTARQQAQGAEDLAAAIEDIAALATSLTGQQS